MSKSSNSPIREKNWAFRTLFLDNTPRAVLGTQNVLLPGTLLAFCFVKQVQVRPGKSDRPVYTWKRASQDNTPKNPSWSRLKTSYARAI
jgi:hypothetical protein